MHSDQKERDAVCLRLRQSLNSAGIDSSSPTELQRGFNKHHNGEKSISVYAAFKWLKAESIPTQDKIQTLAKWLGVSPVWLRYGESDTSKQNDEISALSLTESELDLIKNVRRLSLGHRQAIREFVATMLRIDSKK